MANVRKFPNTGASFLSTAALSTDTTLTVQDASSFYAPAAGEEYTIRCGGEFMLVTGKSGSVLTVTRAQQGTSAAAYPVGTLVFTAISDEDLRRVSRQSLAGTNQTARREVNWILGAGMGLAFVDDATNDRVNVTITGPPSIDAAFTAPVLTDFTWVNQGSATGTQVGSAVAMYDPSHSGDNLRMLVRSAPGTPYTITAYVAPVLAYKNFQSAGLCFRESSSGKVIRFHWNNNGGSNGSPAITVDNFTSPTVFGSAYQNLPMIQLYRWMRIADDGTSLKFSVSADGNTWTLLYSQARATGFTSAPDQVGAFVNSNTSATPNIDASMTIGSWKAT